MSPVSCIRWGHAQKSLTSGVWIMYNYHFLLITRDNKGWCKECAARRDAIHGAQYLTEVSRHIAFILSLGVMILVCAVAQKNLQPTVLRRLVGNFSYRQICLIARVPVQIAKFRRPALPVGSQVLFLLRRAFFLVECFFGTEAQLADAFPICARHPGSVAKIAG